MLGMSSECEPEYETGDGTVVVGTVLFSLGGSKALGDMYGDCNAETNAEDGGEGEFKCGEIDMEGEMGTDFSPFSDEGPAILMVNIFVFGSVEYGKTSVIGRS